ncbi:hypothetical protein Q5H91_09810 [Sphingomonas sp. KR1UV-12]|uniref:Uncharacterized protein n=1 Tax=Sphingomonas aurea TaxID=3063994 RepID=A0ABT9EKL7_9SPHN|nr:hypothetical protein [Sphingomonas sp. KR1UV-12]MDP1027507.1 hypothetical protein [Sphingomonas sp. KR1UV-12]
MKQDFDIPPRPRREPTRADFARAKSMYAAGEGVEHVVVGRWLLTWGKPGRKNFADWLAEQDG